MTEINYEQAVELLRNAVAEKGEDYVYPGWTEDPNFVCKYAEESSYGLIPVCIIGNVANQLGVLPLVHMLEGQGAYEALFATDITFTNDAINVLCIAQLEQDAGETWGLAVSFAVIQTEMDA